MSQDELITALEEDARTQAANITEEAREAAEAYAASAREEASRLSEERLRELSERIRKERAARLNAARTKAAGLKLAVRHELIDNIFREALKRFSSMSEDERAKILLRLYNELRAQWERDVPAEKAAVTVNPADTKLFKERGIEAGPSAEVSLGASFTSADGRVRFDNTVHTRLKRSKDRMTTAVNEMLFDDIFGGL